MCLFKDVCLQQSLQFKWLLQNRLLGSGSSAVEREPRCIKTALDKGGGAGCLASTSHQRATIMHFIKSCCL